MGKWAEGPWHLALSNSDCPNSTLTVRTDLERPRVRTDPQCRSTPPGCPPFPAASLLPSSPMQQPSPEMGPSGRLVLTCCRKAFEASLPGSQIPHSPRASSQSLASASLPLTLSVFGVLGLCLLRTSWASTHCASQEPPHSPVSKMLSRGWYHSHREPAPSALKHDMKGWLDRCGVCIVTQGPPVLRKALCLV